MFQMPRYLIMMKRAAIATILKELANVLSEAKRKKKRRKKNGVRVPSSMLYYMDYDVSGSGGESGGEG